VRAASLLIRTKDEAKRLGAALEAVFWQDLRPHEVFVIDSGSTDATLDIAARYPVRILHIAPSDWGYSRALNLAASHATGEILVCLSAHSVPADRQWLTRLLRHFDDPRIAAVWGASVAPGGVLPSGPAVSQESAAYTFATRRWGMSNQNSALRRALWAEFPFDESMPAAEDKRWAQEAMARGYRVVYDPTAAVWHDWHSPRNAFRRNRAVSEGYKMMFPELASSPVLRRVTRAVWRELRLIARKRRVDRFWGVVRRSPSKLSAVFGDAVGVRRGGSRER
jgi:glycosyltransferase involved in cell wall biosynthesis